MLVWATTQRSLLTDDRIHLLLTDAYRCSQIINDK